MPVSDADTRLLARMTRDQLRALSQDFREPVEVQEAARKLIREIATNRLRAAVQSFEAATPVFTEITQSLLEVQAKARVSEGSNAIAVLGPLLQRFGDLFTQVGGTEQEESAKAGPGPGTGADEVVEDTPPATPGETPGVETPVVEAPADTDASPSTPPPVVEQPTRPTDTPPVVEPPTDTPPPAETPPPVEQPVVVPTPTPAAPAPPPGVATNSRRFSDLRDEYVAMFDAAVPSPEKARVIDRLTTKIVSFRSTYEEVGGPLNVPWYFIGCVHSLEGNFNFGGHLHNGDSLTHRTRRVPAGRPASEVGDPPFAWTTSAVDAIQLLKLHTHSDWSLPRLLFRLERYNGFGYRFRGMASPYLWSFGDRYVKGKFVRDGVFDPNAVSRQCGAAMLLRRLIERGDIPRP